MADETPENGIHDTPNGIHNLTGLTEEQIHQIIGLHGGEALSLSPRRPNRIVIVVEGGAVAEVAADDDSQIEVVVVDHDGDTANGTEAFVVAPIATGELDELVRSLAAGAVAALESRSDWEGHDSDGCDREASDAD